MNSIFFQILECPVQCTVRTPTLFRASRLPQPRPIADWEPCRGTRELMGGVINFSLPSPAHLPSCWFLPQSGKNQESSCLTAIVVTWCCCSVAVVLSKCSSSHSRSSFLGSSQTISLTKDFSPIAPLAQTLSPFAVSVYDLSLPLGFWGVT